MQKTCTAIMLAVLATGCATVEKVAMDPNAATAMRGKTVVRTTRTEKPGFAAMTAGKAVFAVAGALPGIPAGNEIIDKNNVPVPDDAIGQALGARLQGARGMRMVEAPVTVASNDVAQIALAASGKADYVLDVQTVGWQFIYFPMAWGRYKVIYKAQARMIDVAGKKVVAQARCERDPAYADSAPT